MAAAMARGWAAPRPPERCSSPTRARDARRRWPPRSAARRSTRTRELAERADLRRARGEAGGARGGRRRAGAAPRRCSRCSGRPRWRGSPPPSRAPTCIRVMPNVAVEVRRGVLCVAGAREAPPRCGSCSALLGHVVELPTRRFDAATAVMGCAPAYLALVVEALAEAGADGRPRPGAGPRSWSSRRRPGPPSCCGSATPPTCAAPSPRRAAAPRPVSRRSTREGAREAFEAAVRGLAGEDAGLVIPLALTRGDVADYVSALSSSTSILIFAQDPDLLDAADARLQPLAARGARLHHRDDRPLPQPLPPLPAADRRRRLRARPQPDDRR